MAMSIRQEPKAALADYSRVSSAFDVDRVMVVAAPEAEGGPFVLSERLLPAPMRKDYDALPGGGPASWASRPDLADSMIFAAIADGVRVGGAIAVLRSTDLELLDGRSDLALLWDIRVATNMRRSGVGTALLRAVETSVLTHGTRWLKVETQDINRPACHFYARNGFRLRTVVRDAYENLPHESRLLWYKELSPLP